ncbi:phosphoglycolate phosphatase [Pullulanibacillus pueri]|uniref:Phosphoglycolate phosphatase n=1 Tax=Pullulanibacillus pueri TaxID=1437324 RepID=A0A8J3EM23_9BACL|nr:HAD-IA family hydrolase [Pullulanibacillus pueri]MBM7682296.1 phosphoglycolate phosphatase [Pullulanibacillus pueri]GGH80902.1 phosphoglycolate phosphatase [Pullulanibacillus pueri]
MHILWDFDGTLFDTYPSYVRALNQVIKEATEGELYQHLKQSFGQAIEFYQLPPEKVDVYKTLEKQIPPMEKPPFPHVKDVLEQAELNVIMTHKSRSGALEILKHHNMEQYFTEMVSGDDDYPRKPDPASYRYLHEKYRIDLAVGDRALDLIPAKALGIRTCYFAPDREIISSPEAEKVADLVVTSYQALLMEMKKFKITRS